MRKVPLFIPFLLALIFALFGHLFFPYVRLSAFAPFLAIIYNRLSFSKVLWISFGCGLIIDLLSSHTRLGLYALNLVLTTAITYFQRRHFFEDKAIALSLFTTLIALISMTIQLFLVHIFDKGIPISVKTILSDVIFMSALDGLYAFLWFTSPIRLYIYIKKVGWKAIFKKAGAHDT